MTPTTMEPGPSTTAYPDMAARFLVLTGFSPPFLAGLTPEQADELVAGTRTGLPPGAVRQAELDTRIDIGQLAGQVTAPALTIGLTRDHMVPVEDARTLQELIPESRYAEIDSGHLVLFEDPVTLTKTVTDFLADVDAQLSR